MWEQRPVSLLWFFFNVGSSPGYKQLRTQNSSYTSTDYFFNVIFWKYIQIGSQTSEHSSHHTPCLSPKQNQKGKNNMISPQIRSNNKIIFWRTLMKGDATIAINNMELIRPEVHLSVIKLGTLICHHFSFAMKCISLGCLDIWFEKLLSSLEL